MDDVVSDLLRTSTWKCDTSTLHATFIPYRVPYVYMVYLASTTIPKSLTHPSRYLVIHIITKLACCMHMFPFWDDGNDSDW